MQIYLVGGAVRDNLLGHPVTDKDYVVVGATEQQMLDLGYVRVGKDFPVFLHPKTKHEYALARTERKTGKGYTAFVCDSSPQVTLEEDLIRRDLTVNAMAMDEHGNLIDPFNGQQDLSQRILRHVSDAFIEDPLRVLRVARFAARYNEYGFAIHNDTLKLMRDIAKTKELEALSAQRVWQETAKSLGENRPEIYFTVLKAVDALRYWFPELNKLWGIPNPSTWHPEIDTGVHTMMVLQQAVMMSQDIDVRFAALVHDLGKALTDTTNWPSHHGHDTLGLPAIEACCKRLLVPNDCRDLALLTSEHHSLIHRLYTQSAEAVLNLFNRADVWRKPERFEKLLTVCKADFLGRKYFSARAYPQKPDLIWLSRKCAKVTAKTFVEKGLTGVAIKQGIEEERIRIIHQFLQREHEQTLKI
ncbi:multifunctional CCA addition/repair protein [Glaciecola sp. 1036]|uniref:multifunctional CCA addition/repair protein n=1 Tax=Alteromonadaceae TaxID=72275 RepID=UPI003D087404